MTQDIDHRRLGHFAIMWDCQGLEACVRLPDPADTTFALLQGIQPPEMPNLMHWQLRARFNSQRHYEIYIVTAQPGIELDDIKSMFRASPQDAADTIRRIGQCYYSDRVKQNQILIQ